MISLIIILLACHFALLLYKLVILPLTKLLRYNIKGAKLYFFPLLGIFFRHFRDVNIHKDCRHFYKQIVKQASPPRFVATNLGSDVELFLIDTKLIKEFYNSSEMYSKNLDVLPFFTSLTGKGLITSDGEFHKKHRKIIASTFQYKFFESMIPVVMQTTDCAFSKLKAEKANELVKITEEI